MMFAKIPARKNKSNRCFEPTLFSSKKPKIARAKRLLSKCIKLECKKIVVINVKGLVCTCEETSKSLEVMNGKTFCKINKIMIAIQSLKVALIFLLKMENL